MHPTHEEMRMRLNYRLASLSLGLLCMVLMVSSAQAQRFGAGWGGGFASRGHGMGGHFARVQRVRHRNPGYWYGPNYYPYYDDSYSDAGDQNADMSPAPYTVESAAPAPAAAATRPAESVVIELRGDRWVRLTEQGPMEVAGQASVPQSGRAGSPAAVRTETPAALPPAVLVFRDGHQEDIAKYTIVGSTIFLKADYWSSGSWTRKVQVAELDVAATLKANQERGAKFSLPSRPGEVMMRP
jgi:hypothetical protein